MYGNETAFFQDREPQTCLKSGLLQWSDDQHESAESASIVSSTFKLWWPSSTELTTKPSLRCVARQNNMVCQVFNAWKCLNSQVRSRKQDEGVAKVVLSCPRCQPTQTPPRTRAAPSPDSCWSLLALQVCRWRLSSLSDSVA